MTTRATPVAPVCGKGTLHGRTARESPFGVAKCILRLGHIGRCDSGEPPTPEPDRFGVPRAA